MFKHAKTILFFWLVLFVVFSGSASYAAKKGAAAPDFILKSLNGSEITLGNLKGKYLLVNFWATWCGPCKTEMPSLEKLYQRFKANKNFEMLAISNDMFGEKVVRPFIESQRFTFPVLLDQSSKVSARYGVVTLPSTFLIAPDGMVIGVLVGATNWSKPDTILYFEDLLKGVESASKS